MTRPRPRFSLRGLLLLTVAVAAVCWYRDLPRQNANQFAVAIRRGHLDDAHALLTARFSAVTPQRALRHLHRVEVKSQTPADWFYGNCFIEAWTKVHPKALPMRATAAGVEARYLAELQD
jgi:hypothetical protein